MNGLCRVRTLSLAAVLCSCSTLQVKTQYDPNAQFATYKKYAWLATQPGAEQAAAIRDPAVRQLVIGTIDRELAKKGLTRTTPDADPDFFVSVLGFAQNRIEIRDYGYSYAGAYAWGPIYGPTTVDVDQYTNGTLLLDFVDARSKQLFWRGAATDTIGSPEQVQRTVENAVHRMLEGYPPPKS